MRFNIRKSIEPNPIDSVAVPHYPGFMGLVACPGTRIGQPEIATKKVLPIDLEEVVDWGANGFICLLEQHELEQHRVQNLCAEVESRGIWFKQLPIPDMGIPDQQFEDAWAVEGERIRHALRIGERVIFHCWAGLGRTGMMAARILVEMGMDHKEAIREVRSTNRRRIQTKGQSNYILRCHSFEDDY